MSKFTKKLQHRQAAASPAAASLLIASGTKKLYQPEPRPVVYIVPITSILAQFLGRLPLIPAGDHGTIPAEMSHRKKDFFEYGKCDESARPGSGSKLYY